MEQLEPFYERAEAFFGVEGEIYDSRQYDKLGLRAPSWSPNSIESMFTAYAPKLDPAQVISSDIRVSQNVVALLHANATEILTDESGSCAESITTRSLGGKRASVRAKCFVIATGGIENPRLLLNSKGRGAHGLGNERDLVGRFFQEHPNAVTATITNANPALLQKLFRVTNHNGSRYFPKVVLSPKAQRRGKVLNCNAHLTFEYPKGSAAQALYALHRSIRTRRLDSSSMRWVGALGRNPREVVQIVLSRLRGGQVVTKTSTVNLRCYLEQSPNHRSRISLSHQTDALGMYKAQVDWHLTDLELKTLQLMTKTVTKEFNELGLGKVHIVSWLNGTNDDWKTHLCDCAHHMGSTRMSDSAASGVVDRDCKVFGVDNLYIAGSSVFPTSGHANPTLTIVALATRLADHLKDKVK
jgi:choline dehydrogenase-like flavoprotein